MRVATPETVTADRGAPGTGPPDFGGPVRAEIGDRLAVLSLAAPPHNPLTQITAEALARAVDWAAGRPEVAAILLTGAGQAFCSGAGMPGAGTQSPVPAISDALRVIELAPKPVIAVLRGKVVGEGLELALAAHYRIAAAEARLSLPQVALGLPPGAGATQRLPRLIGAAPALELMLAGKSISGAAAADLGLVDQVVPDDGLSEAARRFALALLNEGLGPRPTLERDDRLDHAGEFLQDIAIRRADPAFQGGVRRRIVDCVEAALILPPEAGLEFEAVAFADCLESPASLALRHLAQAEARAARFAETGAAAAREIGRTAVIGGGTRGAGIAAALLAADYPVTLIEKDATALAGATGRVRAILDRSVARGQMAPGRAEVLMRALSPMDDLARVRGCDVVIEAVIDDMAIKIAVLEQVAAAAPDAILATTSTRLDIGALGREIDRAGTVLGLNLFEPPHVVRAAEIAVPEGAEAGAVATLHRLVKSLRKVPVRCAARPGLIGETVQGTLMAAADHLLLGGASPAQIDAAMRAWGFRHGPLAFADLMGLAAQPAAHETGASLAALLFARGRRGRGMGGGFYSYPDPASTGTEDTEVAQVIATERALRRISARHYDADEIRRRCLTAMANAGARLVEQDVARRPSDIDVVMVHAYAFPRVRGGPMHAADASGLMSVAADLARFGTEGAVWDQSALIAELLRDGRGFADLDRERT